MRRLILLLIFSLPALAQGNGYTYLHTIGVTRSLVQADLTSFPLYVAPASSSWAADVAHGGQVQHLTTQTVGSSTLTVPADLIFAKDTACANKVTGWEWDHYDNTTGLFGVHINVDTVNSAASHTVDTVIYACVGNSSVTTLQTTTSATWDSNYGAVWHMPNGTSLTVNDSTANGNNASTMTMAAGTGIADGGASSDGTANQAAQVPSAASLKPTTALTLEGWVYATAAGNYPCVFSLDYRADGSWNSPYEAYCLGLSSTTSEPSFNIAVGGGTYVVVAPAAISFNAWHHIAGTYDESYMRLYVDGIMVAIKAQTGAVDYGTSKDLAIAKASYYRSQGQSWYGTLDELRISGAPRSAAWINAVWQQFTNQAAFVYVDGSGAAANTYSASLNWSPRMISGLAQWYAADAITGHSDGDVLATIPEISGVDARTVVLSVGNLPACAAGATYKTNIQNGLPVLRFGSSSCYQSLYGGDIQTIFYAGINSNNARTVATQLTGVTTSGYSPALNMKFLDTDFCHGVSSEVYGSCIALSAAGSASTSIIGGRLTAANTHTAEFSVNGLLNGTPASSSSTLATPAGPLILGATLNSSLAPSNFLNEDMWELLAFNRSLADYEKAEVISYLSRKWFRIRTSPSGSLWRPDQYWYSVFPNSTVRFALYNASDAATWTVSPQSYLVGNNISTLQQIRDPSIARINGQWCIVNTIPYAFDFQVVCSADLGVWQYVTTVTGGGSAPEWFIDSDGSVHVIACYGTYYLQETHPTNAAMTTWSAPVQLTEDVSDQYNIDPFILKVGTTYYLFTKYGRILASTTGLTGSYTTVRLAVPLPGGGIMEGPSVVRMDGKWRWSFDFGAGPLMYSDCTTANPATCTWGATQTHSFDVTTQHGTLIRVSNPVAGGGLN